MFMWFKVSMFHVLWLYMSFFCSEKENERTKRSMSNQKLINIIKDSKRSKERNVARKVRDDVLHLFDGEDVDIEAYDDVSSYILSQPIFSSCLSFSSWFVRLNVRMSVRLFGWLVSVDILRLCRFLLIEEQIYKRKIGVV